MKLWTWSVPGIAALVLAAAPIASAEEAAPAVPPAPAATAATPARIAKPGSLQAEYALMVKECKLTAEQQAALKDKVEAKAQAVSNWEKANADKLKAARDALQKARQASHKDDARKARETVHALETEKAKVQADGLAEIAASFTPEHREAWDAFVLYRAMTRHFAKAELSSEQDAKVRPMAAEAAREIAALQGDAAAKEKAAGEIRANLEKSIEETALTADQREKLARKPAPAEPAASATEKAAPAPAATSEPAATPTSATTTAP